MNIGRVKRWYICAIAYAIFGQCIHYTIIMKFIILQMAGYVMHILLAPIGSDPTL